MGFCVRHGASLLGRSRPKYSAVANAVRRTLMASFRIGEQVLTSKSSARRHSLPAIPVSIKMGASLSLSQTRIFATHRKFLTVYEGVRRV